MALCPQSKSQGCSRLKPGLQRWPTFRPKKCRGTSPSSWTATAAGRRRQGLPRIEGHRRGAESVRRVTEECARLGIEQLTLYCLSSENWKRPAAEIDFLMQLLEQYMIDERTLIMEQNIRVSVIGRRDGIPDGALARDGRHREHERGQHRHDALPGDQLRRPGGTGRRLPPRGGRCSRGQASGRTTSTRRPSQNTCTRPACPSPTCSIRTAGEMRVSNFLLWQISYAEIWVTDRCWPEFRRGVVTCCDKGFCWAGSKVWRIGEVGEAHYEYSTSSPGIWSKSRLFREISFAPRSTQMAAIRRSCVATRILRLRQSRKSWFALSLYGRIANRRSSMNDLAKNP